MSNNDYFDENGDEVCDNLGNCILVCDGEHTYNSITGQPIDNDIEYNTQIPENSKIFHDNTKPSLFYHLCCHSPAKFIYFLCYYFHSFVVKCCNRSK